MNLRTSRLSIAPGPGLIARQGAVVLLVGPSDETDDSLVDELLALAETPGKEGPALVRRAGALVTGHPASAVPPFAMLVEDGEDVLALLCGGVLLVVQEGETEQVVDGREATTYVERRVRAGTDSLWLAVTGAPDADPRSRLTTGVVRGAGVRLVRGPDATGPEQSQVATYDPAPTAATSIGAEAGEEAAAFEPITLVEEVDSEPERGLGTRISLDVDHDNVPVPGVPGNPSKHLDPTVVGGALSAGEGAHTPPMPEPPVVEGIYCSRGHFNSPRQIFCAQCGISMVQQTHNRVRGPRPPLGVLVTDQGAVFSLGSDYVVGREPESAAEVREGRALPLTLDDPDLALSRVHARIVLDGWEVRVEDANSANGTYLSAMAGEWSRLEPGLPTTIQPGSSIALGGRVLSFETHHRA